MFIDSFSEGGVYYARAIALAGAALMLAILATVL